MKNIFYCLLLLFPLCSAAQVFDADAILDKVVATMKAESPLQMDYSYTVYDGGEVMLCDKGVMRLGGDCYSLVMDKMSVWCNGKTQWSYMTEIDEIYITDAMSDEAQNLSPLFIMENYRKNCAKKAEILGGVAVVELQVPAEEDIEKIILFVELESNRLKGMDILMSSQGSVKVVLDKYQIKCNFAPGMYECPVWQFRTAEIIDMR